MVKVHVGDDQRLNALDIEPERGSFCAGLRIGSLFQAAVDQETCSRAQVQLVAGPGDNTGTAVVGKPGVFHVAHTHRGRK